MSKFYIVDVTSDEYMMAVKGTGKYGNCMGIIIHKMRNGYVEGLLRVGAYLDIVVGGATREQVIAEIEENFEMEKRGNAGNFE